VCRGDQRRVGTSRPIDRSTSFESAAKCIGKIEKGMSLFAITRGQFSMIDMIFHCLQEIGRAEVSVWTWTIAEYEVEVLVG
jgi:hypothetical protein